LKNIYTTCHRLTSNSKWLEHAAYHENDVNMNMQT
jgi:hypothetical protein